MQQIIGLLLGLSSAFFVLSVFASHLQEMLSALLTKRASALEDAIKAMLRDPELVTRFFAHPLIQASATNATRHSLFGAGSGNTRPSYIPSGTFTKVLQSVLGACYAPSATTLTEVIKAVPESSLKRTLSTVLIGATNEANASAAIQNWFDDTMSRLSGFYKRHTQLSLLVVGFILAVTVNANVVHMTSVLWSSTDARNRAETLAEEYAHNPACAAATQNNAGFQENAPPQEDADPEKAAAAQAQTCGPTDWKSLNAQLSSFPVGWTDEQAKTWNKSFAPIAHLFKKDKPAAAAKGAQTTNSSAQAAGNTTPPPADKVSDIPGATLLPLLMTLLGWLGTAVAVSFGSSFWFDLINQVVNLRLSGPKPAPGSKPSASSAITA
jgi:hypothetical protein